MAKLSLLRRALTEAAEMAEQSATASSATVRERSRALGRAHAYRHALELLTNAEGPPDGREWPRCQHQSGCDAPQVYGRTLCRLHAHYLDADRAHYLGR